MSLKSLRDIMKLEIRLKEYNIANEIFLKVLRDSIDKFKELSNELDQINYKPVDEKVMELVKHKLGANKSFNLALTHGSKAEHERSHLIKSYSDLILSIEEEFQKTIHG